MDSTRNSNSKVAVAYLRVSTSEQTLGTEAQRTSIEAWAKQAGVRVAVWREEHGVSGGSDVGARPELARALVDLKEQGAGILVVAKRDRLARDVAIAIAIERAVLRQRAHIVSADGTGNGDSPGDQFMRVVIDAAAQYERALIRARTKAALAAKRARGFRAGGVPFGFVADAHGRLHPNEAETRIIEQIVLLRTYGLSLREVTAECERRGLVSRTGRPFGLTQVSRLARRRSSRTPAMAEVAR